MKNNLEKDIKYWLDGSKEDFEVAQSLFDSKHYPHTLFFCHLSVEKLLKALVVKVTKKQPPYIHDLRRLAKIAEIDLNLQQKEILDDISIFNVAGRYVDAKVEFYKKHNKKEIATEYLKITKDLILWLKKEFQKK